MRIRERLLFTCLLPRQPSACPSWTCFLCILLVTNKNIMHLKSDADCCESTRSLFPSVRTPLSLSLCVCLFCSANSWKELRFLLSVKSYVASLILHASIAEIQHSYCLYLMCSLFDFIRWRLVLEVRAGYVVLMGHLSVTISYSSHCLTIETEKYTNENCFIENLAASKYSMWVQRGKQM